jgi:PAS domain S-box-containing protein
MMKSPVSLPTENYEQCDGDCLFYRFFRESEECMFITAHDGEIIDVNPALEKMLQYGSDELKGSSVSILYENEADRKAYQAEISKNGVVHNFQVALKRKDGTILFCLIDAIIWKIGNKAVGYHGIIRTKKEILDGFRNYFNKLKVERKQLHEERKSLFSDSMLLMRYANDELIDYIQKTGKNPFETANRKVTILFFDIRNSTGIAESLEPDKFASFLSEIFTDIMDLIYGCGGSVNKLLGDGMMAAFGCPLSTDYDAYNAIKTAVMIQEYLGTYNDVKPDYISQQVEVGIGIATGTVFAGLIGSVHRQEYALLGDSVNIASRLESLTRKTEENILIDENTFLEAGETFACKRVYKAKVKGKQGELKIYGIQST